MCLSPEEIGRKIGQDTIPAVCRTGRGQTGIFRYLLRSKQTINHGRQGYRLGFLLLRHG